MSEIIEQGHETSLYINSDQSKYIGKLGWRELNLPTIFEMALKKSVENERLKEKYEKFEAGEMTLGELLSAIDDL